MPFENVAWDEISKFVEGAETPEDGEGLACEIKTYESRYNADGYRITLQVSAKKRWDNSHNRDLASALQVTRYYSRSKDLEYTELQIRSPHIKKALRDVIKEYPGVNLQSGRIVLRDMPRCIFHFREELQRYGRSLTDPEASRHVGFILQYMYRIMKREVTSYYNLMHSITDKTARGLEYDDLWMAFLPGTIVYTSGQSDGERAYKFVSMSKCNCTIPTCLEHDWTVTVEGIEGDGDNFGFVERELIIPKYNGYKPIHQINITPLMYHPDNEMIRNTLIARGNNYVKFFDIHHQWYVRRNRQSIIAPKNQNFYRRKR